MKRIAIYNARPGMKLAREIHNRNGLLLLRHGELLTQKWIDKLLEFGVPTVYIDDESSVEDSFTEPAKTVPAKGHKKKYTPEVPDMISLEVREEAERVVQEVMKDVKTGRLIKTDRARKVVEEIVSQLVNNRHIVGKLADIRILDDYTFAHSVNVCILSVSTGIIMGYSRIRLQEIGLGALLHDVGKMLVPEEILNKNGPLTESEFELIKEHTVLGYEILEDHPDITANSARIAIQHHECFNGSGYPYGIKGDEVHEYSKIVAVADVYDALTADRVYKNAILPYEAMEIIIASSGYQFDPGVVKIFVENIEIYPLGSLVEMSTGDVGMVVGVNRILPTRPIVRLLANQNGCELAGDTEIDLMKNHTIFINKILSFRKQTGL